MTNLVRETDRAIAEANRRFLADPQAIAEAQAEGERYRIQFELEGILPPLYSRPGMTHEAAAASGEVTR